ncbi:MAG: DNA internalization-related competence protein ComEC/Rec2 [Alkalibacterium sp.]|nr:DNA internalization-related competence protein ComEC/Rec2 [Alkalibacterium sp.]
MLIASVPILTYHFYEFSWGVLALNSLFIPFIAVLLLPLLIVNLVLSILIPESLLFTVSHLVTDKVTVMMESFASTIASNVSFTFISGRLSLFSYVLMTCLILVLLLFIEKNSTKIRIALPLTGIFLCLISVRYSPYGEVLMIDVGQGEAILIREPWGRGNYLIDTGGEHAFQVDDWRARSRKFSIGENIMVPVLKSEGIHELESIIITHPDIDHYGSLIDIISEINTRQVVSAEATYFQTNFQLLFPSIAKYGTIITEAVEGSNTGLPANTFALLARSRSANTSKNNSSLVLFGWIGDRTWLFTGDLEIDGEKELLERYPGLTADVLKVGHHGSQTSTHDAFLDQLDPHVAWISCGKSNRYGHPHDDVIDKLTRQDTVLYRTDSQGAVRYRFRNKLLNNEVESQMFSFEQKRERRGE